MEPNNSICFPLHYSLLLPRSVPNEIHYGYQVSWILLKWFNRSGVIMVTIRCIPSMNFNICFLSALYFSFVDNEYGNEQFGRGIFLRIIFIIFNKWIFVSVSQIDRSCDFRNQWRKCISCGNLFVKIFLCHPVKTTRNASVFLMCAERDECWIKLELIFISCEDEYWSKYLRLLAKRLSMWWWASKHMFFTYSIICVILSKMFSLNVWTDL